MKSLILKLLPWVITSVALYFAFTGLEWHVLFESVRKAEPLWLLAAVALTGLSYVLRAVRWRYFFPDLNIDFPNSYRVLILGFFMNNVLPARTGELVRAHLGAKATGQKRTLVLATIASERLVDGLTLSLFFLLAGIQPAATDISQGLLYVVIGFFVVMLGVVAVFSQKSLLFSLIDRVGNRLNHKASDFALQRVQIFIDGLSPLCSINRLAPIILWSLLTWVTELLVYVAIGIAFHQSMTLATSILFLVAVNFSSLIPSAPGAIGVIELIATKVLVSIGFVRTTALAMVVSQHVIQYLVIGIPGVILAFRMGLHFSELYASEEEEQYESDSRANEPSELAS